MFPSVRVAGTNDARALADLRWRWRVAEQGETGMEREEFSAAFGKWMSEHSASHLAWIAETSESAVGMAWLVLVERIPGPGRWKRTAGNVQSVYVVPEHRGAGAGGLLLAAAIEKGREMGMEYLSVHPSERSFSLYRRAGFRDSPGVLELRWANPSP